MVFIFPLRKKSQSNFFDRQNFFKNGSKSQLLNHSPGCAKIKGCPRPSNGYSYWREFFTKLLFKALNANFPKGGKKLLSEFFSNQTFDSSKAQGIFLGKKSRSVSLENNFFFSRKNSD